MTPTQAWAAVVAGEDAAIYAYSIAGARVPSSDRRAALAGLETHRQRRSRAAALLTSLGGIPPTPLATYELPANVDRPRPARRLLADVDLSLVGIYAEAAAASSGSDRRWAARSAADCATAAVGWGAEAQAFPTP